MHFCYRPKARNNVWDAYCEYGDVESSYEGYDPEGEEVRKYLGWLFTNEEYRNEIDLDCQVASSWPDGGNNEFREYPVPDM